MHVGMYVTGSAGCSYADLLDQVEYADRAGLDSAWLRERHFHRDHDGRNFFSSPFVVAAWLAARTERIRLGVGARILPLDHPIHIAEDAATVDVLSDGRLDLGIARVGENDLYERAFGRTPEEARSRFEESLDVILKAWTGEPFSYAGADFEIPEVTVAPRPVQRPHPPIHLVGISPTTLRFGAQRGYPLLMAAAQTASGLHRTQEAYRELLEEAGHRPQDAAFSVGRFVYVADTMDEAIADTREAVMGFMQRENSVIRDFLDVPADEIDYDLLFREVCVFGDAEHVQARLEELGEAIDLRTLLVTFNYFTIDHARCRASMERFVEQVLPALSPGVAAAA